MIITGQIATPSTFKAHATPEEASTNLLNLMRDYPGSFFFTISLPNLTKAWCTGVHGKLGTEMVYTTEVEALATRDKQSRFFSPRECYLVELSIPSVDDEPERMHHATYLNRESDQDTWSESFAPYAHVHKPGYIFTFAGETWTIVERLPDNEAGAMFLVTADERKAEPVA